MLDALRKSATGWAAKILLGLLVISFAIWGVGGAFQGFGRPKLAVVGGVVLSPGQFQREYRKQLFMLSQRYRRELTSKEARALKVAERSLNTLITNTTVNMHAQELGLGIAEKTVADVIAKDPSFRGQNGEFDQEVFDYVLRNIGMSQGSYLALQRDELIRNQITYALTNSAYVPETLAKAFYHYAHDQRKMKYFAIPLDVLGKIETPDKTAIKAYYENHKPEFKAPEYRKIAMILLSFKANIKVAPVTDDEVKAAYKDAKQSYQDPEKRTIEQLSFKDKAAAEEARKKLADGADFLKLGKELGLKDEDMKLGTFTQEQFADKKVAEAAFKLKKKKVSDVIEGFFPVIVRVTKIEPAKQKTFDEVKKEIRETLAKKHQAEANKKAAEAKSKAYDELSKVYDNIEDARKKGANLTEAAKELNLKLETLVFDEKGLGQDGKPVSVVVEHPEIAKLTFESDVGVENNAVSFSDGNAFVDVLEVIPERQKTLEEVSKDIEQKLIDAERRKRLSAKTTELLNKVRAGEDIDAVAKSVKAKIIETPLFKRNDRKLKVQPSTITLAFTLPEKGAAWSQTPDMKTRLVFQVTKIKPADEPSAKQVKDLSTALRMSMSAGVLMQYVLGLQNDYGVTTDTRLISSLINGS
ncbi:MAG: SurA N-terminal domain-containing protein [Alphaproteobacteria bacterium]